MDRSQYAFTPYNPQYPKLFSRERARLKQIFGPDCNIEHFGSTAVPQLGGKGIIDIYVTAPKTKLPKIKTLLQSNLGYEYRPGGGDQRRYFLRRHHHTSSNTTTYYLHLTDSSNPDFQACLAFRDYLRSHSIARHQYQQAKLLAFGNASSEADPQTQKISYQQTKEPVVVELNNQAQHWKHHSP